MASIFDSKEKGRCYNLIAGIYFNENDTELALKYIDEAIKVSKNSDEIVELTMSKISFLRSKKEINTAFEVYNSLHQEGLSAIHKYQLFLLHMDNEDCNSAIDIGEDLFLILEENISTPMDLLSEFAFNIAACFNHKADVKYNKIIEYMGQIESHSSENTNQHLESCETIKELYSSAKDYFRLSLDYDETPNQTTKDHKRKMRSQIRKIDNTIIPALSKIDTNVSPTIPGEMAISEPPQSID